MYDLEQLVNLSLAGNQNAWNTLYQISYRAVYFTCISFVKNEADANDLIQETYIAAWQHLNGLEDKNSFLFWINRIAANKCKDFLKKRSMFYVEELEDKSLLMEENEQFLPDYYAENQEKRQIVFHIMQNTLSDVLYRTVILYYFHEMTAQEIADFMECPLGTVTYRLCVAREKIKRGVLEYEQKSGERLYSVVGLPILTLLFQYEVYGMPLTKFCVSVSAGVFSQPMVNNFVGKTGGIAMKKALITKIIVGVAAVAVAGGVIAFVMTRNKNDRDGADIDTRYVYDTQSETTESENISGEESYEENTQGFVADSGTINYNDVFEMWLCINGIEIKLNETTVDEYLAESGWSNYTENEPTSDVCSSITLHDGINEIKLIYLNNNKVIFQAYTNIDFDNSVTDLKYRDNFIGEVSIGDTITEDMLKQYSNVKEGYNIYLSSHDDEAYISLEDEQRSPLTINYLYYDDDKRLTGVDLWWYLY